MTVGHPFARIKPIINPNGESRENHVQARIAAADAVMDLLQALAPLKPHGRDYPGAYEQYEADRAEWGRRYATLDALRNTLFDEALAIHKGGE